jgi:dUTP pyrophosphatase
MKIRIKKTHPDAIIPTRQKPGDSGLDLHALLPDGTAWIAAGERKRIRTGIAIELPEPELKSVGDGVWAQLFGYEAQVRPRSGLADKSGVMTVLGTIDNGYRGEIAVILFNHSYVGHRVANGDRIAQLVLCPVTYPEVTEVDVLADTERGTGGFGSTGV